MLRRKIYSCYVLIFILSFSLPLSVDATPSMPNKAYPSQSIADFPVVDPIYIYNQLAYTTSHFQRSETGYTSSASLSSF